MPIQKVFNITAIFFLYLSSFINCAPPSQVGYAKQVVKKSSPAIVKIIFLGIQTDRSTGQEKESTTVGTGVLITEDGFILTADHVVGRGRVKWPPSDTGIVYGFKGIRVITSDGKNTMAGMVTTPEKTIGNDLALLLLGGNNIFTKWPHLEIANQNNFSLGEPIIIMGYPTIGKGLTVTDGIVTNIDYSREEFRMSAVVTPGSSGGPILTANGKIIGLARGNVEIREKNRLWGFNMTGINVALRKEKITELIQEQRKNWKK